MTEEFVTFEISKKLYRLGFKEPSLFAFAEGGSAVLPNRRAAKREGESISVQDLYQSGYSFYVARYDAPTISQVLKWLREEKRIFVAVNIGYWIDDSKKLFYDKSANSPTLKGYYFGVWQLDNLNDENGHSGYFRTFKEAVIAGIEYALDNLIQG